MSGGASACVVTDLSRLVNCYGCAGVRMCSAGGVAVVRRLRDNVQIIKCDYAGAIRAQLTNGARDGDERVLGWRRHRSRGGAVGCGVAGSVSTEIFEQCRVPLREGSGVPGGARHGG